jgi:hypothetical protein
MKTTLDDRAFLKTMENIVQYSIGFLEGAKSGKTRMLESLGDLSIEQIKQYIDSSARVNPEALHHIYEWDRVGSPNARLFDLHYTVSNLGLSIKSTFSQSSSVKSGSKVPFYDKARIMEQGIPVTIKPVAASVLSFTDNGETVFTKNPVQVSDPGGEDVQGAYQRAFDSFMSNYFSQSFLNKTGILGYLSNPVAYKRNLPTGSRVGKSKGRSVGYDWVANVGVNR